MKEFIVYLPCGVSTACSSSRYCVWSWDCRAQGWSSG